MTKVVIGIQARSTSSRCPKKVLRPLGDRARMLDHIIYESNKSCSYLRRWARKERIDLSMQVALLVPENDIELVQIYSNQIDLVTIPDVNNVLGRYTKAMSMNQADHIVRITGDCPFIKSYMISRAIKAQIKGSRDYTSNVVLRSSPEGTDVEVISKVAMDWIVENVTEQSHIEHVTTALREKIEQEPDFMKTQLKIEHLLEGYNLSFLHMSVDTEEDFIKAENNFNSMKKLKMSALRSGVYSE